MNSVHPTVADILALMEAWAPAWTAESWDRVGLVCGHPRATVAKAWVALELDDTLLEQAIAHQVQMLLLHHPPLFKPLNDLRADRPATARLIKAAAAGLAIHAAHTNLDAAPGGVNDELARRLGLVEVRPLVPLAGEGLAKLVVFVPPEHHEPVAEALFAAGAGQIGDYRRCAFATQGTGRFLAPADGRPFLGRPGQEETVGELRLETIIPLALAGRAIRAMLAAHPYEEPAYDLYPLKQAPAGCGLGRVGELAQPRPAHEFAAWAAEELCAQAPLLAGPLSEMLTRVAVLGGSGGDLLGAAASSGAQMLITGEARYHAAQEARDLGLALLTLGHFQTEAVIVEPWARRLARELEGAGLACQVRAYPGADPWRRPWAGGA